MEFKDNLDDMQKKFMETTGATSHEATHIVCRNCGMPCMVRYTYFPCKDEFVPERIRCHLGCNRSWKLTLTPEENFTARETS